MKNIEQYKRRFNSLLETTMGDVRPLISEEVTTPPKNLDYTTWVRSVETRLTKSEIKYIGENKTWVIDKLKPGSHGLFGFVSGAEWIFLPEPKFEILNFNIEGAETIKMKSVEKIDFGGEVVVKFEIKRDGVGTLSFFVSFENSRIMSPEEREDINKKRVSEGLTESELTNLVRRVIKEQNESEKVEADAVVGNINPSTYCSPNPPSMISNILNKLPGNLQQEAKDFIKKFASVVKGKSVKELISIRKQIKGEKEKGENVNEAIVPIVIAGLVITPSLLIAIGAILLFIIIIIVVSKSSKGGGSCNPGWWDSL